MGFSGGQVSINEITEVEVLSFSGGQVSISEVTEVEV